MTINSKEDIRNYIASKNDNIDLETLKYYTNYFWVLFNDKYILGDNNIEELIDNGLYFASKLVFYDENHEMYKKLGSDIKGYRDSNNKIIYVRDNLEEPLREITVYHELHHAVQTSRDDEDNVGIKINNMYRLVMEAQTQYFAEKVYSTIHNIEFENVDIPSEYLRMSRGGTIVSNLHNYQLYDSILTKFAILLGVNKDFFVKINYLYKNNEGLNILKELYKNKQEELNIGSGFNLIMFMMDYIYCVDLIAYVDNEDKELVLSGGKTKTEYEIYPGQQLPISQKMEYDVLDKLDRELYMCLVNNNLDIDEFIKYIFDNQFRNEVKAIIEDEQNTSGGGCRS